MITEAPEQDLPIADYEELSVAETTALLNDLSQIDLAKVDAYERSHANRRGVLDSTHSLRRKRVIEAGNLRVAPGPRSRAKVIPGAHHLG